MKAVNSPRATSLPTGGRSMRSSRRITCSAGTSRNRPSRSPRSAVDVAIVGARNPEQIRQTAPAADIQLSPQDLAQIEHIVRDEIPVGGPAPEKM
jgi:hypothetical protein